MLVPFLLWAAIQEDIVFVKRETKEDSRRATIEATIRARTPKLGAWKFLGPFSDSPASFRLEKKVDFSASYRGLGGRSIRWQEGMPPFVLSGQVYFLACTAEAAAEAPAAVQSGAAMVWINGSLLSTRTRMRKGSNRILLRVHSAEIPFTCGAAPLGEDLLSALEDRLEAEFPSTQVRMVGWSKGPKALLVEAEIQNTGRRERGVELELSGWNGANTVGDSVPPGATVRRTIEGPHNGAALVSLRLRISTEGRPEKRQAFMAYDLERFERLECPSDSVIHRDREGLLHLHAGSARLIFDVEHNTVEDQDFCPGAAVQVRKGETWSTIGILGPWVQITRNGEPWVEADHYWKIEPAEKFVVLRFLDPQINVRIGPDAEGSFEYIVTSNLPVPADQLEGPILRVMGELEQSIFPGLEFLGRAERSSGMTDMEAPDCFRTVPKLFKVTMPLLAAATDRGSAGIVWLPRLAAQPAFSSPNDIEGTSDHRLSLSIPPVGPHRKENESHASGKSVQGHLEWRAVLWTSPADRIDGFLLRPPLPQQPPPVRDPATQLRLCAHSLLDGPLWDPKKLGWGHCLEPNWQRQPYPDFLSTLSLLSQKVDDTGLRKRLRDRMTEVLKAHPDAAKQYSGGSHIPSPSISFVAGRVPDVLENVRRQVDLILLQQQKDGSFHYEGKYRKGHFEDTASGLCADRARTLLDFARFLGDERAKQAGLKCLDYMKRFRVPRGAQTWEIFLHTPDILAAAHLVSAYVSGYELTGKKDYLDRARYWAICGLPFVYLWGDRPIMKYATIAVYGATNGKAPVWIGLPVQWCGIVYAYDLLRLAPHDNTVDWRHLARGIWLAALQMQDPASGCLPDSFDLEAQRPRGPFINPCAMVSLQLALMGEADVLWTRRVGDRLVTSTTRFDFDGTRIVLALPGGKTTSVLIAGSVESALLNGKPVELQRRDQRAVIYFESQGNNVIDLK